MPDKEKDVPEEKRGTVEDPNVVDPYAHLRDLGKTIDQKKKKAAAEKEADDK